MSERVPSKRRTAGAGLVAVLSACLVLVGLMLYYWNYPFPNGRHPSVFDFVMFWFRELVILALGFAVTLYAVVVALFTPSKARASPNPSIERTSSGKPEDAAHVQR